MKGITENIKTLRELTQLYNEGNLEIDKDSWFKCYFTDEAKTKGDVAFMPGTEIQLWSSVFKREDEISMKAELGAWWPLKDDSIIDNLTFHSAGHKIQRIKNIVSLIEGEYIKGNFDIESLDYITRFLVTTLNVKFDQSGKVE